MKFKLNTIYKKNIISFEESELIQNNLFNEIYNNKRNETLLFLEIHDVFTAGRSSNLNSDIIDKNPNIPIVNVLRGGKITYHGPGQLIIYFYMNLKNVFYPNQADLRIFINMLEVLMANSLSKLNIKNISIRPEINHGLWINDSKIMSIGINIKKYITSYGIAININPNLGFFDKIIPCGMQPNYKISSLHNEGYDYISKENVIDSILENVTIIFKNYKLE